MKTIQKEQKNFNHLKEAVFNLNRGRVLVIGDLMIDTYLIGDSTRISPEAPVPVVKIEQTRQVLGGAGNVARSIVALGGSVSIFGVVGKDNTAKEMQELFQQEEIEAHLFALDDCTTTIKTRVLARGQQMLRMDMESGKPLVEQELKNFCSQLEPVLQDYEYIIVSDYAKGVVTKELMTFLTSFTNKKGEKLKILADPKPENKNLYENLFLLTPNLKETSELVGKHISSKDEVENIGSALRQELNLNYLLTTLSSEGMALFSNDKDKTVWHIPTAAKQVFDVTGAGDTVIASLALALSAQLPILDACILANYAAGIVVGKVGSATATQEEILTVLKQEEI